MKVFSWSFKFLVILAIALSSPAFSQDATVTQETVPGVAKLTTDPKELMLQAAQSNGLTGADVQPWHLKATFKTFDEKGSITDQGTYEEFWASPTKFKRIYASATYRGTDYGTDWGVLRSGTRDEIPTLLIDVRREFAADLPSQQVIERESFNLHEVESSGARLSCLRVTAPLPDPGVMYCLSTDKPILRISAYSGRSLQVLHNRILGFQGHFVAGDLNLMRGVTTLLTAHLENIEVLNPVREVDFAPPPNAVLLPRRVNISAGVAVGMIQSNRAPLYPPDAKAKGVSGTVVLKAVVGVDGRISDVQVISGPPLLQQAAIDAVRDWKYRPYLLNGSPVEINTQINIVFTLGR